MGRKYANPPIIEAICEFRLSQETPWDLTVPGLLYQQLKDSFPEKEQGIVQAVELIQGPAGVQHQIRTSERQLFFAPSRKLLVQVGPRLLVINALKPYPHWEGFRPHIAQAWNSLARAIEVKGLDRLGLRYINGIELPESDVDLAEYFDFYPFVGSRLPQKVASFIAGAEFLYGGDRDCCRVQLSPTKASVPQGKSTFILDLDYFIIRSGAVSPSEALSWVEEAHDRIEEIFEGCITDALRKLFEEMS